MSGSTALLFPVLFGHLFVDLNEVTKFIVFFLFHFFLLLLQPFDTFNEIFSFQFNPFPNSLCLSFQLLLQLFLFDLSLLVPR